MESDKNKNKLKIMETTNINNNIDRLIRENYELMQQIRLNRTKFCDMVGGC
ncbi:MAG TPA: hypothetical protein VF691_05385 [Cytophagaceae bacterium]|jgi:hypothetical protein